MTNPNTVCNCPDAINHVEELCDVCFIAYEMDVQLSNEMFLLSGNEQQSNDYDDGMDMYGEYVGDCYLDLHEY